MAVQSTEQPHWVGRGAEALGTPPTLVRQFQILDQAGGGVLIYTIAALVALLAALSLLILCQCACWLAERPGRSGGAAAHDSFVQSERGQFVAGRTGKKAKVT